MQFDNFNFWTFQCPKVLYNANNFNNYSYFHKYLADFILNLSFKSPHGFVNESLSTLYKICLSCSGFFCHTFLYVIMRISFCNHVLHKFCLFFSNNRMSCDMFNVKKNASRCSTCIFFAGLDMQNS